MRNKLGSLLMIFGAVLIIGAFALFMYNRAEAKNAGESSDGIIPLIIQEANSAQGGNLPEMEVPKELLTAEDLEMTETVIDGRAYIGYLSMPSIDLILPVLSAWNYDDLKIAPCRYYGSLKGEDFVIMAHNYQKHFGGINKLKNSDIISFTDMDGKVTEYEVIGQDVLDPFAVEEMTAGDFDLTLFTCNYSGEKRIAVYCEKIK